MNDYSCVANTNGGTINYFIPADFLRHVYYNSNSFLCCTIVLPFSIKDILSFYKLKRSYQYDNSKEIFPFGTK